MEIANSVERTLRPNINYMHRRLRWSPDGSHMVVSGWEYGRQYGIFLIDDFGRQLISPRDLLNRWIVPLDRRVDYLSLQYGVKFQIPFEVMVVFATNLDPNDLADEAFLRRIHNKIFIEPVHQHTFDEIFRRVAGSHNISLEEDSCENLRRICLSDGRTELRACYPLDVINILTSIGRYEKRPVTVTRDELQRAASMYFAKA